MNKLNVKVCVVGMVSTNCYIVYRDLEESAEGKMVPAVIIDPGDNAPYIIDQCKRLNLHPEAILLTHGHFDHIMAAEDLRQEFHVPIMAGEKEMRVLKSANFNSSGVTGTAISLEADRWLGDGETVELLGVKWKVLFTPGHTEGSVCYYIEDEKVLFSGDTLFCKSFGRTDFPTGNTAALVDSITRVLFKLPEETSVCPGHEDMTTIEHEKKRNPIRFYMR